MSPLATLQRGYAVVQDADGHVVTSVDAASTGAALQVRLADGRLDVTVDDRHQQLLGAEPSDAHPTRTDPPCDDAPREQHA